MDDRFNTTAGWVLFAGIVALGSSIASGLYFHADSAELPEGAEPGYFVQGEAEEAGGGAGPDIGTLLASADVAAGEKVFAKCSACHTINQGGANGIGPNLWGVLGTAIGAHAAGFAYSSALTEKGGEWTYEAMDAWLASPRGFASGTKMSFAGLSKPEDRANVIAYMHANGGGPPFPAPAAPAEGTPSDTAAEAPDAGPGPVQDGEADVMESSGAMSADQPVPAQNSATRNSGDSKPGG